MGSGASRKESLESRGVRDLLPLKDKENMHLLPLDESLSCSLDTNKTIDNGQHKLLGRCRRITQFFNF